VSLASAARSALHNLTRPRGTRQWDAVIRGTGVLALLGIYPILRWPELAGLMGFLVVTIIMNGPISPIFPASYEPVLMLAGRVYQPWIIAAVGTAGTLYMEYINYYIYGYAVFHPKLDHARGSVWVRTTVDLFKKGPFLAIVITAFTPLPYWVVRILGPLAKYPIDRYLLATFIGRFPRLWFYAALGLWIPVSAAAIVIGSVALAVAILLAGWYQRRRVRRNATAPG
jgi:membrane protein YqaA with SNARE-associated domain